MPDVSIQSALGVLLNYNGLTNRFIEGSPTYITEGISDSSITSNGTIFSGTNGYLVKTFGNTTLNKYYPEFKITCSGYLRDLRDITKDILYPVYSGNIKYSLSDVQIRLLIKLVQAPNTLGIYGDIVNSTGSSIETFKLFNLSVYNQPVQSLTITALFNGVQFPFTVTRDMSIARADTRTVCITKEDVLQEIRVRKTDATNQLKSLDRYNKIVEECEKVEQELLGDDPSLGRISSDDNRILALEKKIEELTKIISNGINRRNEEITTGDVEDGK